MTFNVDLLNTWFMGKFIAETQSKYNNAREINRKLENM